MAHRRSSSHPGRRWTPRLAGLCLMLTSLGSCGSRPDGESPALSAAGTAMQPEQGSRTTRATSGSLLDKRRAQPFPAGTASASSEDGPGPLVIEQLAKLFEEQQQALFDGRDDPEGWLELVREVVLVLSPHAHSEDLEELWSKNHLLRQEPCGTVALSFGPPPAGSSKGVIAQAILFRESEGASYLNGLEATSSQLRVFLGLGTREIRYCAVTLQAIIPPTVETVERLETAGELRVGATHVAREGMQSRSEIVMFGGTKTTGAPFTTSEQRTIQQDEEYVFGSSSVLSELNELLRVMAGN